MPAPFIGSRNPTDFPLFFLTALWTLSHKTERMVGLEPTNLSVGNRIFYH